MGAALDKMSITPSELPGGAGWAANCAALNASQVALGLGSCDVGRGYGDIQVVFLLLVYAYILYTAANLISDGSEMLEWIGALRKLVGPIILPILGAIPDGAMVLFSGLGDNAQSQVSVGVVRALSTERCCASLRLSFRCIYACRPSSSAPPRSFSPSHQSLPSLSRSHHVGRPRRLHHHAPYRAVVYGDSRRPRRRRGRRGGR